MRTGTSTAAGLLLGFALDRVLGDPRRWHPVAGFGSAATKLEAGTYRDSRAAGVLHEVVLVGGVTGLGIGVRRLVRGGPADRTRIGGFRRDRSAFLADAPAESLPGRGTGDLLLTAIVTWTVLGGRSLARTGREMADRLESEDIDGARGLLPSLCGRDPEVLDADGLARAALESIAENTSDATVAPLFWGAVAGVPGLLAYRAINTLDAMVGYRNERYGNFGWAAARTDDVANLAPARLAGALTTALAPIVGGRPADAWRAWRRDASKHPSPNAGVAESTMAGALGIRLGGRTQYRHGIELRPTLGDGPTPQVPDLHRAVTLSEAVQLGAALTAAAIALFRR
ncbi:cobalamin biosynthesis protein [Nocardia uniformis]|uniref:cobalamin biosynthesis protein n=1 Tax=Nocardia uniformis TaxID=53432 RepID=UPI001FE18C34|nr:cobalamin biosynthesis protein [Nocardia uniformis]